MLIRQRTILRLVEKAERPLTNTVLFKLVFLLRKETTLSEDTAFYDFVPYHYGPYSFAMHRELETLVSYGYLNAEKSSVGTHFTLGPVSIDRALPPQNELAIDEILNRYANVRQKELLRDVYERYSWYAINTQLRELAPIALPTPKCADSAIYTIGYHKSSVDSFANQLIASGIQTVVDVRANPISRKYGFAGSSLKTICNKVGLEYKHFPKLGIPSSARKGVSSDADFNRLFLNYQQQTLRNNREDVVNVSSLVRSSPSVLLCAEQDARSCHRSRLAFAISEVTGLPIINL